jgi:hypothetical protein
MKGMLRLAGWGVAATAALLTVVIAANSTIGRERLAEVLASVNGTAAAEAAKARAEQAAHLARMATLESDTRRLVEMVRSLAGDRERLMARISVLERGLNDVTGSIHKQQAAAPAPAPANPAASTAAEPPAKATAAPPQTAAPAETGAPAAAAAPPPAAPPSQPPKRVASVAPTAGMPELEAVQLRAAGVDIGGATSFDALRTLWSTVTASYPDLFEGLQPIVTVRENSKSRAADLRLIAGPLTDAESATHICTMLAAAKRYCRLVTFEGQPLALNAPAPPRQPAPAKPRPTVRAAPAPAPAPIP